MCFNNVNTEPEGNPLEITRLTRKDMHAYYMHTHNQRGKYVNYKTHS